MKQLVLSTKKQFDSIEFLPFNRTCKVRQDLIEKMNKYGFVVPILIIETDIITGKKETYVFDGQHRLVTAQYLGLSVIAEKLDVTFNNIEEMVKFVASLNVTHKSWDTQDYVDAFAYLNYEEYRTLNSITSSSPFSVNTIASMLYGFRSKNTVAGIIKEGIFKCKLLNETKETLKFAAKLSKIGKLSSRMISALHYVMHTSKNFDDVKFTEKYSKEYQCIKELKLDDYTDVFSSWL